MKKKREFSNKMFIYIKMLEETLCLVTFKPHHPPPPKNTLYNVLQCKAKKRIALLLSHSPAELAIELSE